MSKLIKASFQTSPKGNVCVKVSPDRTLSVEKEAQTHYCPLFTLVHIPEWGNNHTLQAWSLWMAYLLPEITMRMLLHLPKCCQRAAFARELNQPL